MSQRMEVPSWLVAGVLVLLVGSVGLTGWLLGQRSVRSETVVVQAPAPAPSVDTGAVPPAAPERPPRVAEAPPVGPDADPVREEPPRRTVDPPDPMAGKVAAYFDEMDDISLDHPSKTGDPQGHAQQLVSAAMSGDTSGFDELIAANDEMIREFRRMSVPSPCKEHHRRTIAVVEDSSQMLRNLKASMSTQDIGGLMNMQAEASALEAELKAVDALGESVRAEYGV